MKRRNLRHYRDPVSQVSRFLREEASHKGLPDPSFIEPEVPDTMAATEAPEVERVKKVLEPSLHVRESARSSNGAIALLPAVPETADCPMIAAVEAAEKIEKTIFDWGYHIIVRQ